MITVSDNGTHLTYHSRLFYHLIPHLSTHTFPTFDLYKPYDSSHKLLAVFTTDGIYREVISVTRQMTQLHVEYNNSHKVLAMPLVLTDGVWNAHKTIGVQDWYLVVPIKVVASDPIKAYNRAMSIV